MSSPRLKLLGAAPGVESGLQLVTRHAPDVVLVDLGLPDGSGIDLIRRIAAACPRCEVMVLTGATDSRQVLDAIAAGATGYLLKEESDAELVAHIEALSAGGSPVSPGIARHLLQRLRASDASPATGTATSPLSEQEQAVLTMIAKGLGHDDIAAALGVSLSTVQTYVKRCYRKLQVHSKTQAVHEARRRRWIDE